MEACAECRDEVERLRPAADALPRSVEQMEPPPGLKASIMDVVEPRATREAGRGRAPLAERCASVLPRIGRAAPGAWPARCSSSALRGRLRRGPAGGRRRRSGRSPRRSTMSRLPRPARSCAWRATATTARSCTAEGMPALGAERVYQAWVAARRTTIVPQPTFVVGRDGQRRGGAARGPERRASAVLVTRERARRRPRPSEQPVLQRASSVGGAAS